MRLKTEAFLEVPEMSLVSPVVNDAKVDTPSLPEARDLAEASTEARADTVRPVGRSSSRPGDPGLMLAGQVPENRLRATQDGQQLGPHRQTRCSAEGDQPRLRRSEAAAPRAASITATEGCELQLQPQNTYPLAMKKADPRGAPQTALNP